MISSLSIIIPAYNEEAVIAKTLSEVGNYLSQQTYSSEIILVNDGSTDDTAKIASGFSEVVLINNKVNTGKGASIKRGVAAASKDFILFIDADLAISINNCNRFINFASDFDIVIGSKYIDQKSEYPIHRKVIGKTFSFLKSAITGLKIKDTQCGFKLYRSTVAKELFQLSNIKGWCFDVEILLIAQKKACKIKELPINVKNTERISRINVVGSGIQMLYDLVKLRINLFRGKYR